MPGPIFQVASESIKAFPTFLPSVGTVRHFDPHGADAFDMRLGQALALTWSLVVCIAYMSDKGGADVIGIWIVSVLIMMIVYELALRDTTDIR